MENRLEYYRPRGAQGNYKAILKLQYVSSETVEVICFAHSGEGYGRSASYSSAKVDAIVEGKIITYPPSTVKSRRLYF